MRRASWAWSLPGLLGGGCFLAAAVLAARTPATQPTVYGVQVRADLPFRYQDSSGATFVCVSSMAGTLLPPLLELPTTPLPAAPGSYQPGSGGNPPWTGGGP